MQSTAERFRKIKKVGAYSKWTQDFYHTFLAVGWLQFFGCYIIFFLLFNLAFGLVFWNLPSALQGTDGSFWQAFVFSVQTFSTVGYGVFSPQTTPAHVVMVIESILSVFVTALLTGLIFSKFSKPSARILFSKNILISQFEGKKTLMLRIGNMRTNEIAEANIRMVVLKNVLTAEGVSLRRQYDLKLVRSTSLFFALSWSVLHVIDEESPLFGLQDSDYLQQNIEFGLSVIGYDSTFSQTIHANCIYEPKDVLFGRYFEDVLVVKNGLVESIDYRKFNALK